MNHDIDIVDFSHQINITESYTSGIYNAECFELLVKFVLASEKGQLPYKGQNARSQFVRYLEVLLYYMDFAIIMLYITKVCPRQREWYDINTPSTLTSISFISEKKLFSCSCERDTSWTSKNLISGRPVRDTSQLCFAITHR